MVEARVIARNVILLKLVCVGSASLLTSQNKTAVGDLLCHVIGSTHSFFLMVLYDPNLDQLCVIIPVKWLSTRYLLCSTGLMGMTPSFFTHFCQAKNQSHDFQCTCTYNVK